MRKLFGSTVAVLVLCSLLLCLLAGCTKDTTGKLTLEKYNRIENGMTYDQVKEIIGSDGTLSVESGEKGSQFYTVIYKWDGVGSPGANASFTFQGETPKLQNKAQAGLK